MATANPVAIKHFTKLRFDNVRAWDIPKTKAMYNFLLREAPHRVTGLSIEPDGVFIYTDSEYWQDDSGAGTFREDSETTAIKQFYERVQPGVKSGRPFLNPQRRKKIMRKKNPDKGSVSYHKRIDFRALDVFVDAVSSASKPELQRAVKTASEMSKDLVIPASERPIWKRLATILRAQLKGYAKNPRARNPKENRSRIISGVEYEVMFTGDGWRVMKIDGSTGVGTTEFNAGKGDAGRKAALAHLKGIRATPTRKKTRRKKNPEIETRELSLYADNLGPSSQGIEKEVYELRTKFGSAVKRQRTKKELMSLAKFAAHRAARAYSHDFGSGAANWQEIFNDKDLNDTAKYLFDSWCEEYSYTGNPKRRARKNPVGAVKPRGFIIATFIKVYNSVGYALDSNGGRMDFRKGNAKVWKTKNGADRAAQKVADGWGDPVAVFPVNSSAKQIESIIGKSKVK